MNLSCQGHLGWEIEFSILKYQHFPVGVPFPTPKDGKLATFRNHLTPKLEGPGIKLSSPNTVDGRTPAPVDM